MEEPSLCAVEDRPPLPRFPPFILSSGDVLILAGRVFHHSDKPRTYAEIGRRLGVSANRVWQRLGKLERMIAYRWNMELEERLEDLGEAEKLAKELYALYEIHQQYPEIRIATRADAKLRKENEELKEKVRRLEWALKETRSRLRAVRLAVAGNLQP